MFGGLALSAFVFALAVIVLRHVPYEWITEDDGEDEGDHEGNIAGRIGDRDPQRYREANPVAGVVHLFHRAQNHEWGGDGQRAVQEFRVVGPPAPGVGGRGEGDPVPLPPALPPPPQVLTNNNEARVLEELRGRDHDNPTTADDDEDSSSRVSTDSRKARSGLSSVSRAT